MSSESAPEAPEYHTQPLSPASPRPAQLPSPSNIPLLENQMDPSFSSDSAKLLAAHDSHLPAESSAKSIANDVAHRTESGTPATSPAQASVAGSASYDSNSVDTPVKGVADDQTMLNNVTQSSDSASHTLSESVPASFPEQATYNDNPAQSNEQPQATGNLFGGQFNGVNIQALLDNLTASASASSSTAQNNEAFAASPAAPGQSFSTFAPGLTSPPPISDSSRVPALLPPGTANLPPRPPPQGAFNSPSLQHDVPPFRTHDIPQPLQTYASSASSTWSAPTALKPILTGCAPGTAPVIPKGLPPPPSATFQTPTSGVNYSDRRGSEGSNAEDELPWGREIQEVYDSFLNEERKYVTEGQWEKFPANSRLFIGNLPTEKVTKRDLFHVFHRYGKLAQVSIKQAYGFIQFVESADCLRAISSEQGVPIRGRKVHLEISKPCKTSGKGNNENKGRNQRGSSPDRGRVATGGKGADRYRGSGGNRMRAADEYRPGRSPSPRSRNSNGGRYRDRSVDRYDGRRRSRSPNGRNNRFRSPSPGADDDDALPLPRRAPRDVPDIQIIARDDPDRAFLTYVEKAFESRGVRCNVLMLSSRLNEAAVMRRQILEGVSAVMKLGRINQATQKFGMSLFDRSGGANVRFDEYSDLDLHICVELVIHAKQNMRAPEPLAGYTLNQYGLPVAPPPPRAMPPGPPNPILPPLNNSSQPIWPPAIPPQQRAPAIPPQDLSNNIANLDASSLQHLLNSLQNQHQAPIPPSQPQQRPQQYPPTPQSQPPHSPNNYGRPNSQQQNPHQTTSYAKQSPINPNFSNNMFSNGANGQTPSPQSPGAQNPQVPDMQNIMAQLAKYGR